MEADLILIVWIDIRPGAWLVDWIPVLDRLPDALAPWRAKAISVREQIMPFYAVFVDEMRKRVDEGSAPDCFVAQLLEDKARAHWKDYEYQHVVAELMTAGTETTATTLQWFFKAAILNPEPIKLARKEIDDVVGRDRMPEWSDRPHLLYMDALVNELHRWASAAPLSFFHATSEDDVYRGKKITKGTVVAPNAYAVHKNPLYYPKPDTFMPERFLDPTHPLAAPEANPYRRHFGFSVGRRECPGQHVADASLYIMISRIIWAFDIRQKPDVPPGPGYSKFNHNLSAGKRLADRINLLWQVVDFQYSARKSFPVSFPLGMRRPLNSSEEGHKKTVLKKWKIPSCMIESTQRKDMSRFKSKP